MTSQAGSKIKFLIVCNRWLRRSKQPYQIETKPRMTRIVTGIPLSRAAESTDFKRLQLRLRLRPENIDSDSNSDSTFTPPSKTIPF